VNRLVLHVPHQPLWFCRGDGQPWPCAKTRLDLFTDLHEDRVALFLFLAAQFTACMNDLYKLNPSDAPDPDALYQRFFGWIPPRPRT
jgi:hypothetical protein